MGLNIFSLRIDWSAWKSNPLTTCCHGGLSIQMLMTVPPHMGSKPFPAYVWCFSSMGCYSTEYCIPVHSQNDKKLF